MAPKITTNPTKLANVLTYFHSSGVAHSIKDLEKSLPSVASINSMQVKDYLAALSDDNKIHVEKIGSGNWYWAFASEEKRALETEIEKFEGEVAKGVALVEELKGKVEEAKALRAEEDDEAEGEVSREVMFRGREALEAEVEALKKELSTFSDNDPAVIERKKEDVKQLKGLVSKWTDDVEAMESYLVSTLGVDRDAMTSLKRDMYGSEFDEEVGGLKELGL